MSTNLSQAPSAPVIRNYKDTVFRMLFNNPKELLGLFNAVNGTAYRDEAALEIVTLENAVYMNSKNDLSCILDLQLQLYEHQSTINPNIPLRDLQYVAKQIEKLIIGRDIYSRKSIVLPVPKFFVFYNGIEKQPERKVWRLSDLYKIQQEDPALELQVIQLNINDGYNEKLKQECSTLMEYMIFVDKIRTYQKEMSLKEAVNRTVEECIREDRLREFLTKNKAEVIAMSIFEYDEELHKKTLLEEGYEDGLADGRKEGLTQGREEGLNLGRKEGLERKLIQQVVRKLKKEKTPTQIAEELEEELSVIERICKVAEIYAPEYKEEKIYKDLKR